MATPIPMGIPVATGAPSLIKTNVRSLTDDYSFPPGLVQTLQVSVQSFPVRFWIVDNSGSMNSGGGTRLVSSGGRTMPVRSTRWDELSDSVRVAGEIATALGARTDFHLLNACSHGKFFTIADNGATNIKTGSVVDMATLRSVMQDGPRGGTPLTEAVNKLIADITPAAEVLRAKGQQAAVVIATDGLPNAPQTFLEALQRLQELPVWVVVRLCTNEDSIVNYWSNLDKQLEAPLEVIDDIGGEASEISKLNPWLTYGPPLHYAREFGVKHKIFDLLDERALLPTQAKELLELILGCESLPEPEVDLQGFLKAVEGHLDSVPSVYNPMTKASSKWVDVKSFRRVNKAGKSSGSCVIS